MKIFTLDLGNHTGWATLDTVENELWTGTFDLSTADEVTLWKKKNDDRRCDPRIPRLFSWLPIYGNLADVVVFEDVEFCKTVLQCQLWSALRSTVWCAFRSEKIECVPVGVLKKFATGNGNAEKIDMAEALRKSDPFRFKLDNKLRKKHLLYDSVAATWGRGDAFMTDNAIDAAWIAKWAAAHIKR